MKRSCLYTKQHMISIIKRNSILILFFIIACSDEKNTINSLDDNQNDSDQRPITSMIDQKETVLKDKKNNIDIKVLENKRSKSNFI